MTMKKQSGTLELGTAVLVTTAHRGVFFGYFASIDGDTITLTNTRNCLYWPSAQKGFLGLATAGPLDGSRVGPKADRVTYYAVTAVALVSEVAIARWEVQPWS